MVFKVEFLNISSARDVLIISVMDTVSSLLAGCVIFSVLGSMAFERGIPVSEVANKDGKIEIFDILGQIFTGN